MWKVFVTKECIGCGLCVGNSNNFIIESVKAFPIRGEIKNLGDIKEAKDQCPVSAIKVKKL